MSKTRTRIHWYVLLAQVLIISVLALRSSYQDATADETVAPTREERRDDRRDPRSFQPAGESTRVRAIANRSLSAGDGLWTDGGVPRAELTTRAPTDLLDASPGFEFSNLDDRLVRTLLIQWTVTLRVQRPYGDEILEVDTSNWAVSILQAGSYRVEASEDGPSTLVTAGAGETQASGGGDMYTVNPSVRPPLSNASPVRRTEREAAPGSTRVASSWPKASRTKSIAAASLESSTAPSDRITATRFPSAGR
jgi:hypothetical protein